MDEFKMFRSNLASSFHHLEVWAHIVPFISKSIYCCYFNFRKTINVRIFNDFCKSFLVIAFCLLWTNFLFLLWNVKQSVFFTLLFEFWNNINMFCDITWKFLKLRIIFHKSLHVFNRLYFSLTWTLLFEFLNKLI